MPSSSDTARVQSLSKTGRRRDHGRKAGKPRSLGHVTTRGLRITAEERQDRHKETVSIACTPPRFCSNSQAVMDSTPPLRGLQTGQSCPLWEAGGVAEAGLTDTTPAGAP